MRARIDGAWRTVGDGRVRINGEWRTLASAKAYIGGAWVDAASFVLPLTVSTSPAIIGGFTTGTGTALTNSVTATPSGGVPPYTYSWARVGFGSGVAGSPSSATTTFSRIVGDGEFAEETFRVTVTSGAQTATADVSVTFSSIEFGP